MVGTAKNPRVASRPDGVSADRMSRRMPLTMKIGTKEAEDGGDGGGSQDHRDDEACGDLRCRQIQTRGHAPPRRPRGGAAQAPADGDDEEDEHDEDEQADRHEEQLLGHRLRRDGEQHAEQGDAGELGDGTAGDDQRPHARVQVVRVAKHPLT